MNFPVIFFSNIDYDMWSKCHVQKGTCQGLFLILKLRVIIFQTNLFFHSFKLRK